MRLVSIHVFSNQQCIRYITDVTWIYTSNILNRLLMFLYCLIFLIFSSLFYFISTPTSPESSSLSWSWDSFCLSCSIQLVFIFIKNLYGFCYKSHYLASTLIMLPWKYCIFSSLVANSRFIKGNTFANNKFWSLSIIFTPHSINFNSSSIS